MRGHHDGEYKVWRKLITVSEVLAASVIRAIIAMMTEAASTKLLSAKTRKTAIFNNSTLDGRKDSAPEKILQ